METRQLESRIASLRGKVRRLLALHGLSLLIGAMIPLLLLAGSLDWLFHLDRIVRLVLLVSLALFAIVLIGRYVVGPLVVRFRDLDIALRIEERWPGLNDRLASTVQFLQVRGDDSLFGSSQLREATVKQTLEETKTIDFREVVEYKPVARALGLAVVMVGLMATVFVLSPQSSRLAARRLLNPFGSDVWPQQTHLTLLDKETPRKIAKGEPFSLGVAIGPGERMPTSAKATYRFDNGDVVTEALRSIEGGIFRGRMEAVETPFRFSVVAGDDSESIRDIAVKVVPPPTIRESTVRLLMPEYTRLAPVTLAPGKTQIRAVTGTMVEITAVASKPLASASLKMGENRPSLPAELDASKTRVKVVFMLNESVPFWFDLLDQDGFKNREVVKFDARSLKDEAPRVVIDEPSNDRNVPATAKIPIKFSVDDDFGIQSGRLLYKIATGGSEPTEEVVLPLWDSTDGDPKAPLKHLEVPYKWDLAPLKLEPGAIITFQADARDFDAIHGPNVGRSRDLRLRILSDADISRELDDSRRAIREDIEGILAMENQARTPVDEALRTLDKTKQLPKKEADNLKNAEMVQRQVANRVTNKTDGLDQKIRNFLDDLENFNIPNPDARRQMEEMKASVGKIRENDLDPADQGLTKASKSLEQGQAADAKRDQAKQAESKQEDPSKEGQQGDKAAKPDAAKQSLAEAQTHQKAISDELKKMLDGLSEFETYRGIVQDAQDLLKQHEQTMKQTDEASGRPELTGKTPDKLSPEQKAELSNLANRQSKVADGLQDLKEKMKQMAAKLDEADPLAAAALKQAADEAAQQKTDAKIGQAADQLEKNQMGAAKASQEQARRDLKDLLDSVQNRREKELSRLVKELKAAEAELKKLKERQTESLKKTQAAKAMPDPKAKADELKKLGREQAEMKKELEKQLKKLQKLNANKAAKAGENAAAKMGKAEENLDQEDGDNAEKNEEEALADLEEAQDELEEARKEAEEQLANEQIVKMSDQLKSLSERQAKLVTDTVDYEKLKAEKQGKLTKAQRSGVGSLAAVEDALKDETSELTEKLAGAQVFALTLKRASQGMTTAAERLKSLQTDEETQRAAASASARLKQLIDSLQPDQDKNGGQQQKPPPGGDQGGGGGGGGDGIPPGAQLKMLKSLQEEINERTAYYDELKRRGKELKPEQTAEIDKLQEEQGTLADIVRDLTKPKKDDGED